jgi:hypothetical protein
MSLTAGPASADDPKKETPAIQTSEVSWFYNYAIQLGRDSYLHDELQVVDYQQQQLKSLNDELQPRHNELMKEYREAFTKGDYQKARDVYTKEVNAYKEEYVERVKKVLLAHQVRRIEQLIRRQKFMYSQRRSPSSYYGSQDDLDLPLRLAEELDLSDSQLEKLRKAVAEERRKMEEEIAQIKKRALQEVIGSLPSGKRREFLDLVGKPYDFAAAQEARSERFREEARKHREAQEQ